MRTLGESVDDFIQAILETPEYQHYHEEKEKMHQWPELKEKIDEFRRRNMEIQQIRDENRFLDEMEKFEREFEDFTSDSRIHEFLKRELSFCRMMQEINRKVTDSLDFE